jgi:hypothetical protein
MGQIPRERGRLGALILQTKFLIGLFDPQVASFFLLASNYPTLFPFISFYLKPFLSLSFFSRFSSLVSNKPNSLPHEHEPNPCSRRKEEEEAGAGSAVEIKTKKLRSPCQMKKRNTRNV